MAFDTLDLDTVEYPPGNNPTLRLSVSEEEYSPQTGLNVPLDLYVEKFDLTKVLTAEIENNTDPARYGLFTHQLKIQDHLKEVGFSLCGSNGKKDSRNGKNGGILELYVEDLPLSTAQRLGFKAIGGTGWSPLDCVNDFGEKGGDGGDGGRIRILYGAQFTSLDTRIADILFRLRDGKSKWPSDFRDDADKFVKLLDEDAVKASNFTVASGMETASGILMTKKAYFRLEVQRLYNKVGGGRDEIDATLMRAIDTSAGDRGFGSHGDTSNGESGRAGKDGNWEVQPTNVDELCHTDVCFAHPLQCQMLLDRANFHYFQNTVTSLAAALDILERLQRRLAIFKDPRQQPEPNLWKAYRSNATRLFTIEGGPSNREPHAICQLRAIRQEAEITFQQISSGRNFFGQGRDEVPRGSYDFYHKTASKFLTHLREMENAYLDYRNQLKDAASKLADSRVRARICDQAMGLNGDLITEAGHDIQETGDRIRAAVNSIQSARDELLAAMQGLDDFPKRLHGVKFEDVVSALTCVLFTGGHWPMVTLQTASLLHQDSRKVLQDDGLEVEESYLIQQLHEVEGSIEGLVQGFKVLEGGSIKLDDPGSHKLHMAREKWEALLNKFRASIPDTEYKAVMKKFEAYLSLVEQRNSAVLHYNSTLALLIKYYQKRDRLKEDKKDITRGEYGLLDAGHPMMTRFLGMIYKDNVHATQVWLYKEQQALRFISLNSVNVIGEKLQGAPISGANYSLLSEIQTSLYNEHEQDLERLGQPAQTTRVKYPLDDDLRDCIAGLSAGDVVLRGIEVPCEAPQFHRMYDIRLSAVRFYAEGATSQKGILQVVLTHSGTETFVDRQYKAVKFTHSPLTVMFEYTIPVVGDEAHERKTITEGTIALGKNDPYARVGPFTKWRIEILRENNESLDLEGVTDAYLEFEFAFRTR